MPPLSCGLGAARGPAPGREQRPGRLKNSKPNDLVIGSTFPRTNSPYTIHEVEIRSVTRPSGNDRKLVLECYTPHSKAKPAPVILILPIIGGDYPLERHFARYFARHGMAAVLLKRDNLVKGRMERASSLPSPANDEEPIRGSVELLDAVRSSLSRCQWRRLLFFVFTRGTAGERGKLRRIKLYPPAGARVSCEFLARRNRSR